MEISCPRALLTTLPRQAPADRAGVALNVRLHYAPSVAQLADNPSKA